MMVEHRLVVTATCPVDGGGDVYWVTVRTHRVMKVEDILEAVKELTSQPAFQESMTESLHRRLSCEVESVGWHSGVQTRVVCGG